MQKSVSKARKNALNLILISIALIAPVLSAFASLSTKDGSWFARSGSITVLLAAIVQFRLGLDLELSQYLELQRSTFFGATKHGNKSIETRVLGPASLLLVILGTAIWGYGDLLYAGLKTTQTH